MTKQNQQQATKSNLDNKHYNYMYYVYSGSTKRL